MAKSSRSSANERASPRESAAAPEDAVLPRAEYVQPIAAATRTELSTGTTPGMPLYVGPPHWRAAAATGTTTAPTFFMAPPQGPGAPRRFRIEGSPKMGARLNCALRVLLDPVARTRPTRAYSGQKRNGND
jgi:hypothetical protein